MSLLTRYRIIQLFLLSAELSLILRLFSLFLYFSLLLWAGLVQAAEVKGIFSAQVPVYQQKGFDKRKVFAAGLEKVLLKLTGVDKNFEDERFTPLKNIANTLVQEYQYNIITTAERKQWQQHYLEIHGQKAKKIPNLLVQVRYAKKPIIAFLKRNKIPYWTKLRPKTLLWLLYSDNEEQLIVNRMDEHPVKAIIRDIQKKLALPIQYPYLDKIDHQIVNSLRLQEMDMDAVMLASERYSAYNIVILHINQINDSKGESDYAEQIMEPVMDDDTEKKVIKPYYKLEWVSNVEQTTYAWESQSDNLYDQLYQGMLTNVAYIVQSLNEGIESDKTQGLKVIIEKVHSYQDMVRVQNYLKQLPRVNNIRLYKVTPHDLSFYIELDGDVSNLDRFIRLKNILRFKPKSSDEKLLDQQMEQIMMSGRVLDVPEAQNEEAADNTQANNPEEAETLYLIYQGN